jgi:protein JSN1
MTDAINAKEDVLGRLGGLIGMANGQPVRIGFGKADSAPLTPVTGGGKQTPTSATAVAPSLNTLLSPTVQGVPSPLSPGIESQLQSSPTRALWIGSIPSTTTPATILSIFSPFGPIESARVLTHKNCGFSECCPFPSLFLFDTYRLFSQF